jgi:hypothetical protein
MTLIDRMIAAATSPEGEEERMRARRKARRAAAPGDVRRALAHHVFEEERTWFSQLQKKLDSADESILTTRFLGRFVRYWDGDVSTPKVIK